MATEPIGTVLTVEDEVEIRELTVMYAEALGFRVLEADDGEAALAILQHESPDIIVSDMRMPKKDGLTLLKELRESGVQVPFLFLSAFTSKDYTIRALSLGAFDYLEKPFLPNELKALLHEMLRVSKAQKGALAKAGLSDQVPIGTNSPEAEILKMVSLRIDGKDQALDPSVTEHVDPRMRLLKMFIAESKNQLSHGLQALKDLKHSDSPGWQLGYLFRLMYSIRSTATSLQLEDIRELTLALEHTYAILRVRTSYLNKMTLATLQVAQELLYRHLDHLKELQPHSVEEAKELFEETKNIIQDLKVVGMSR